MPVALCLKGVVSVLHIYPQFAPLPSICSLCCQCMGCLYWALWSNLERDLPQNDVLWNMSRFLSRFALSIHRRDSELPHSAFQDLDLQLAGVNTLHCGNIAVGVALLPIPITSNFQL